jgi:hypothetical protein
MPSCCFSAPDICKQYQTLTCEKRKKICCTWLRSVKNCTAKTFRAMFFIVSCTLSTTYELTDANSITAACLNMRIQCGSLLTSWTDVADTACTPRSVMPYWENATPTLCSLQCKLLFIFTIYTSIYIVYIYFNPTSINIILTYTCTHL